MTFQPEMATAIPRILCIEDDKAYARLLNKRLTRAGYQVDLVGEGKLGLKQALDEDYALLLVDYQLPDMDGISLIEILSGRTDTPPMILLSSLDDATVVFQAIKRGAEDYIVKSGPDDFQMVLATIEKALEKRRLLNAKRQAEQAFFRQSEVLRKVIDNIPCGVFWKDAHSVYQGCNERFRRDAGLASCDQIVGMTDKELHVSSEEALIYQENDRTIINTGKSMLNVEVPTIKQGADRTWLMSKVPLAGSSGQTIGVAGIFWDITERKHMEQANIEYGFKLQEKVLELRRKNEEIKKTQKQLISQEKLASLGAMTAGIAHEIRNPLNFIQNMSSVSVEYLEEIRSLLGGRRQALGEDVAGEVEDLLDDLKRNADVIQKHGARAAHVVKSMTELAGGGAGRPTLVGLNALVMEYLSMVRDCRSMENISVLTDYGRDVGRVEVMGRNLGRVLVNLLNNALDALDEKMEAEASPFQATLNLKTQLVDNQVEIRLRDNGVGIAAKDLDMIFDPFFTTKATGKGHIGLGLALSHEIVAVEHSGSLTVESEVGQFTEFTIRLPRSL